MSESDSAIAHASPPGGRPQAAGSSALRSIAALMLREMTARFGRKPGSYAWALLQPLAIIIVLAYGWSLLMRTPSLGTSFILYKATALLILLIFRSIATTVGKSLHFSRALLAYPGVTWIDALLARFILNVLIGIVVTWIIVTGIILYEDIRTVFDWPRILLAIALTCLLGLGVGVLNCYLFERFVIYENIWGILTAPLLLVSGVIIHYEQMPYQAQQVLWYNPLLHLTGLLRDGIYPTYRPEYISIPFILTCALVPMVFGLLLVRRYHREIINR